METNGSNLIVLSRYSNSMRDLQAIRNQIRLNLGERLLEIDDLQTLRFETLKQFKAVENQVKNSPESIAICINKVMSLLKAKRTIVTKITQFKEDKEVVNTTRITSTDVFNELIFGFEKTPKSQYLVLRKQVEIHLQDIHHLIKWYETKDPVIKFKLIGKGPGNSEERMLIDFYRRCLSEREQILDYYLVGVKERAIQKANAGLFQIYTLFHDLPYKSWRIYTEEYFDCRKISYVYHRLVGIEELSDEEATQLYQKNKTKFYKRLFSLKSPEQIFENIFSHIEQLPIDSRRLETFTELKKLFKRKQWLAFFAVALPQVEGLFAEMLQISFPGRFGKSLTEIVEDIRPISSVSEAYFDYYQYILPKLRNQFMHTGHGEDYKLRSYDLLTDLEHVVIVFYELKHPFVKVNRILQQRRQDDFINYEKFAYFFGLLSQIESSQFKEISIKLKQFIDDFLILKCDDLKVFIQEALIDIQKLKSDISILIEKRLDSSTIAHEIVSNPKYDLKSIVNKYFDKIKSMFLYNRNDFDRLDAIKVFRNGVRKYFKSWSHSDKQQFLDAINAYQPFIYNITELRKLIES